MGSDRYLEDQRRYFPPTDAEIAKQLRRIFITREDCERCNNTGRVSAGFEITSGVMPCNCGRGINLAEVLKALDEGGNDRFKWFKVYMGVVKPEVEINTTFRHLRAKTVQEAEAMATVAAAKQFNVPERDWQIEKTEEEDY